MAQPVNFEDDFLGQHLGQLLIRQPSKTTAPPLSQRESSSGSEASSSLGRRHLVFASASGARPSLRMSEVDTPAEDEAAPLQRRSSIQSSSSSNQQQQHSRTLSLGLLSQTDAFLDNLFSPATQLAPPITGSAGASSSGVGAVESTASTEPKGKWQQHQLFSSPLSPNSLVKDIGAMSPLTPPSPSASVSYFGTNHHQSSRHASEDAGAGPSAGARPAESARATPMKNSFSTSFGARRRVARVMEPSKSRDSHQTMVTSSRHNSGSGRAVQRSPSTSSLLSDTSSSLSPRASVSKLRETGDRESNSWSQARSSDASSSSTNTPSSSDLDQTQRSSSASSTNPCSSVTSSIVSSRFMRKMSNQSSSYETELTSSIDLNSPEDKSDGDAQAETEGLAQEEGESLKGSKEERARDPRTEFDSKLQTVTEEEAWRQWRNGAAVEPPETPKKQGRASSGEGDEPKPLSVRGAAATNTEDPEHVQGTASVPKFTSLTSSRSYVRKSIDQNDTSEPDSASSVSSCWPFDARAPAKSTPSNDKASNSVSLSSKPAKSRASGASASSTHSASTKSPRASAITGATSTTDASVTRKKKLMLVPDGPDGRSFKFVETEDEDARDVEEGERSAGKDISPVCDEKSSVKGEREVSAVDSAHRGKIDDKTIKSSNASSKSGPRRGLLPAF